MQLTIQDIFDLNEGLYIISEKELPVAVAFKLQRIHRIVGGDLKTAQELRSKIVTKYKEKDLENGQVKLKEDKLGEFNAEIDELMKQEIKVDTTEVALNELGSIQATPKTLGLLHKILKEEK